MKLNGRALDGHPQVPRFDPMEGERRGKREGRGGQKMEKWRKEDSFEDVTLLALKVEEGAGVKEYRWPQTLFSEAAREANPADTWSH